LPGLISVFRILIMLRLSLVAVALASLSFANADNFTIDPNSVAAGTRCKQ
jgi:hypothetical protein